MGTKKPQRRPRLKKPYRNLLPPHSREEYDALGASIKEHGVLDSVAVTEDGKVLDGHTRLKFDPDAPRRVIRGLTEGEQQAFTIKANFARRNLSAAQKKALLKTMRAVALKLREEDRRRNTHKRIAGLLGVARQTVATWLRPSGMVMHGADNGALNESALWADSRFTIPARFRPAIVRRHLAGESQVRIAADYKVSQATISRIIARHGRDEQSAREADRIAAAAEKLGTLGVIIGDYRTAGTCVPDASADLVLTDPPYARKEIEQYRDLGRFAARVLKPGASLVVYANDRELPTVLSLVLESESLHFWWPIVLAHGGRSKVLERYGVAVKSRLLLWFTRGGQRARRAQVDSLIRSEPDKRFHEFGQGVIEAQYLIERLVPRGGLVVDPFCGGGTVPAAATEIGRRYIAFEKDRQTALRARARIKAAPKRGNMRRAVLPHARSLPPAGGD